MGTLAPTPPPGPASRSRLTAAALLFTGALGLAGYTAHRALRVASVVPDLPGLATPSDATEAANRRREFAGTFATGNRPGDRALMLHADGRVDFTELGAKGPATGDADTYQLRRRDKKFAFVTTRTGVIDALDLDTLTYWGDTYRRR